MIEQSFMNDILFLLKLAANIFKWDRNFPSLVSSIY